MICRTRKGDRVELYDRPVSEGGEGFIYKLKPSSSSFRPAQLLAKLYRDKTVCNENKLLVLRNIFSAGRVKGIAYPKELLYDDDDNCIGFLMLNYSGDSLHQTVFNIDYLRRLSWSRVELARLAINILDRFIALHSCDVMMADVNPFNIMVLKGTQDPVFVDVDSYQVGDRFPCYVSRLEYISPRLNDSDHSNDMFRVIEDEYYAIAVLLFNIFLVGKHPYSRSGAGSIERNLRNRDFVFPEGYDDRDKMPKGPWQRIWYNLPYNLRKAFYQTFRLGEYSSPSQWKEIIEEYHNDLIAGKYPRVILPKNDLRSIKNSIQKLDPRPFAADEEPGLRRFDTALADGQDAQTVFLEMGTNSIRAFSTNPKARGFALTNHFKYISNDGKMDVEKLEICLKEPIGEWLANVREIEPPVTHLHAFGGAMWRNLCNRNEVMERIQQRTGITFGVLTAEEESVVLVEAAKEYDDGNGCFSVVDVSGVSLLVATRESDGSLNYWEFGDLGSKILSNCMFATSHIETRLATKLQEHDAYISSKIGSSKVSGSCRRLFGYGIIREICSGSPKDRHTHHIYTKEQLEAECKRLTNDLLSNRTMVSVLNEDLNDDFNGRLERKLDLRLSLSVYISLMEKLNVEELVVMPFNAGKAYMYYNNK